MERLPPLHETSRYEANKPDILPQS